MTWYVMRAALITHDDYIWIAIGASVMLLLWLAGFLVRLHAFKRELRYVKSEIQRNRGRERAHWEKKKRRLWMSLLIPFIKY